MPSGPGRTDLGRTGLGRAGLVLSPTPRPHFGVGAVRQLPGIVRGAGAGVEAVAGLADRLGMSRHVADLGVCRADFDQVAADALDDEVLANTPRPPTAADIRAILRAAR